MIYGSINTRGDLDALVGLPEGQVIEFKREIAIEGREQRVELLKDLTGMGNGGGGAIVFGIAEAADGVAESVTLLQDRATVGRVEDLVRSSVSPPLLAEYRLIEHEGGFVLVVDVQRSPLGPYMVQAFGQARYFTRVGTRTFPMSEPQVRDAYALSQRARDDRDSVWQQHLLPLRFGQSRTGFGWPPLVYRRLPSRIFATQPILISRISSSRPVIDFRGICPG